MRRALAALLAAVLAALGIAALAAPAGAQDAEALSIREVDATDPENVQVTFTYQGDRADLADLVVREAGEVVESSTAVPLGDQQSLGIVLAVDASGSMNEGALIERVLDAARSFVEEKRPTTQVAIVTFNREVRLVQDFTTDEGVLLDALEEIPLGAETSVYDGIVRSASLFEESSLQPNIIVFSDGGDTTSSSSPDRARASVVNVGGALFALGVENPGFDVLRDIAAATGGTAAVAADPSGVQTIFESVQDTLERQFVVTFTPRETDGTIPITLTAGGAQATAEYVAGSQQQGAASLRPIPAEEPPGPAFLRGTMGLLLGLGLLALAAVVAVYAIASAFLARDKSLGETLQPYSEGYVSSEADDEPRDEQLVQTPLLQRAVQATGSLAERQGLLTKVEALLDRADLALRPAEAIFVYLAGMVLVAVLLLFVAGSPIAALIGIVIVAVIPPATLSFLASRRQKAFDSLLPDTLQLLASTLKAGYSLMQGVEAVSQEVQEPVGKELRRVVTEARLGRPLEEAMDGVAERMGSADFAWAVMAIRIQREVGGNLAELLMTVAETMTERERLRRDVNALTAEGRVSAVVLGLLPVGIGIFIMGANPGYLDPLFDESLGNIMLGGAAILMGVGFFWMKKTIEIEI